MTSKVKGTEGVEFPDGTVQSSAAYSKAQSDAKYVPKVGQRWQDVTASRQIAGGYGNDTNLPIQVSVVIRGPNGAPGLGGVTAGCQGVIVADVDTTASNGTAWNGLTVTISFTVPVGASYQLVDRVVSNTLVGWRELR